MLGEARLFLSSSLHQYSRDCDAEWYNMYTTQQHLLFPFSYIYMELWMDVLA